jgi:toxin-antitoxin system PIN domain toxin
MVILDSNILLYATMPRFDQHKRVKQWLEEALSTGPDVIGITWQVATGFVRIGTNRRIFDRPLDLAFVQNFLSDLFAHRMVTTVAPTDDHWRVYSKLLTDMNLTGDVVMDAHIAAIAIEHKASVASTDKDFRRFSDHIKIVDPLAK